MNIIATATFHELYTNARKVPHIPVTPGSNAHKINYMIKNGDKYKRNIIQLMCLLIIINSITIDVLTDIPIGWIINIIFFLFVENYFSCLNCYVPKLLRDPINNSTRLELLYDFRDFVDLLVRVVRAEFFFFYILMMYLIIKMCFFSK